MASYEGYGAVVTITGPQLVIDRKGIASMAAGRQQMVPLSEIVGIHVKEPSLLTNGWVQLCVGSMRDMLGRDAPSDPLTVLFTRRQRVQLRDLVSYLQGLVEHNHRLLTAPIASTVVAPTLVERTIAAHPVTQLTVPSSIQVRISGHSGPSFVGFDVETANGSRGSICAIGLTVVKGGRTVETHSWLCRPPEGLNKFAAGNILIHGIRPQDVSNQPSFRQRFGDMLDVIGDLPLVAHNAAFDIGAIREASATESMSWRPLTYGCTLKWSRLALPGLPNHKLPTVASELGVDLRNHHDASADAAAAAGIALELMRRKGSSSVDTYVIATGVTLGRATVEEVTPPRDTTTPGVPTWVSVRASATPPAPSTDADQAHPLFGQTVVITGTLTGLSRDEAWAQIAKHGARVNKTVTRKTTVLIAGTWIDDDGDHVVTEKLAYAQRLETAGQKIVILDQEQLHGVLAGDRSVQLPDLASADTVDAYALADDSAIAPHNRHDPTQQVRGRHYTAWSEPVKQLKRDGRLEEAITLLLEVIEVVERPENCWGGSPAPGWTEQAAIVYRKQKDYASEIAVLQRWVDAARRSGCAVGDSDSLVQRMRKAEAMLAKTRQ